MNNQVTLNWIPAHSGQLGNGIADKLLTTNYILYNNIIVDRDLYLVRTIIRLKLIQYNSIHILLNHEYIRLIFQGQLEVLLDPVRYIKTQTWR